MSKIYLYLISKINDDDEVGIIVAVSG